MHLLRFPIHALALGSGPICEIVEPLDSARDDHQATLWTFRYLVVSPTYALLVVAVLASSVSTHVLDRFARTSLCLLPQRSSAVPLRPATFLSAGAFVLRPLSHATDLEKCRKNSFLSCVPTGGNQSAGTGGFHSNLGNV